MKFNRRATARPVELLDAALTRFLAVGFALAKVEEIAQAAGVTAGTVYRYFPSKEVLFSEAILRHVDAEWCRGRELSEAYGSRTAREIIALLLGRWAEQLRLPEQGAILTLVVREGHNFPELRQEYISKLLTVAGRSIERALRHGMERGEFSILPVEATAQSLAATVLGNALWDMTFPGRAAIKGPAPIEIAIDMIVRGLPRTTMNASAHTELFVPIEAEPEQPAQDGGVSAGRVRIRTMRAPGSDPAR